MNISNLTRRVNALIADRAPRDQAVSRVVLYNAATGDVLPGQVLVEPGARYVKQIQIWIPDNGRDGYAEREV